MSRRYRVTHRTSYEYDKNVTSSFGRAHLLPRDGNRQTCLDATVTVTPAPAELREHTDWFGNRSTYFAVTTPHRSLTVLAESTLTINDLEPGRRSAPAWESVRDRLAVVTGTVGSDTGGIGPGGIDTGPAGNGGTGTGPAGNGGTVAHPAGDELAAEMVLDARAYTLPSPRLRPLAQAAEYARHSFPAGRPVHEAAVDLTGRIHRDFRYVSGATTVGSTVAELFDRRAGVCQDFAHLAVCGLRSLGLAARYVSGYLETVPPPGRERLIGADASHAWVSVFTGAGWLDLDPTNDRIVDSSYVELAHGRDYGDVPPLKGVIFSDSTESVMRVAVDIIRIDGG